MRLRLVHPPYVAQNDLFGVRIASLLTPHKGALRFTEFSVAVAFTKLSGLGRLAPALQSFRHHGGRSVFVSGIDLRGTSSQALDQSLQLFDDVFVYFDSSGDRTFHPKLFILKGASEAHVFIGSNNMTRGGLYTNYELSVLIELDLRSAADSAFLADVETLFATYSSGHTNSQRLTQSLLQTLVNAGLLYDETRPDPRPHIAASGRVPKTRKSKITYATPPSMPAQYANLLRRSLRVAQRPNPAQAAAVPARAPIVAAAQPTGFWKRLSANDVSATSSPGQIVIPKAYLSFFPPLLPTANPYLRESYFAVEYIDATGTSSPAPDSRLILYVPKPTHKRPNIEYRFTFRDPVISGGLQAGDVLVFELQPPPYQFRVWHVPKTLQGAQSYAGPSGTL